MSRRTFARTASAALAATVGVTLLSACGGAASAKEQQGAAGGTQSAQTAAKGSSGRDHDRRTPFTATHVGGPTTILEIGGARLLLDPTFDRPKKYPSGLEKIKAPAFGVDRIGKIDAVLLSHDQHDDNLDDSGRALLKDIPAVYSTPGAHQRLGAHVTGLRNWESRDIRTRSGSTVKVTAVPALHGPDRVDRGADGEVTGFVLSGRGVPTTYISGDNASVKVAAEVGKRIRKQFGRIDTAVLFAGAARTPAILDNAPLTLTSQNAARVAADLDPRKVVAVHTDSWNIYSEDMKSLVKAFRERGVADKLVNLRPDGSTKWLNR
ncbi:MBL fold metallo-hydrolase [Streptomyces sp. NPDC004111]|uniref:MBL fold metallo-hydrolase n=1 Tax=Streptomyces sp. NPDC004111 TaxID=3364690 RepID=UPI003698E3E1